MSLTNLNSAGQEYVAPPTLAALRELQGVKVTPVVGAAANTKMTLDAIRQEDTIIAALYPARGEVQTVAVDATGGTFTITYSGQTTAAIAYNATAEAVQDALNDLSNIAPGDVMVTGGPGASGGGSPYILWWNERLGNVAAVTTDATSLTGGGGTATVATSLAGRGWADDKANVSIVSVRATATLTFSTANPTADETFSVNGVTYTFKAAANATKNTHVALGDTYEDTAENAAAAINLVEGLTGAAKVTAAAAAGVVTLTATTDGPGSAPTVTDTGSTITIDSTDPGAVTATFASAGYTDAVTINGVAFTIKTSPAAGSAVEMGIEDTDAEQAAALVAKVRAYQASVADLGVELSAEDEVVTITAKVGRTGNSVAVSESATNVAASGAYLSGGTNTGGIKSTTDHASDSLLVYWMDKQ